MTRRTTLIWFTGGALAALLLAILAGPVVADSLSRHPQQGAISPAITGSSPLVLPAAEFRSDGSDSDGFFFTFSNGYARGEHHSSCLMAPVYLPQFATIDIIYASAYDNDSDSDVNMWIRLYRVNNYSGVVDQMAFMETTSDMNAIQILSDPSIDHSNVNYPYYSYYVGTCLESAATRLYSVRLYYTERLIFLPVLFRTS